MLRRQPVDGGAGDVHNDGPAVDGDAGGRHEAGIVAGQKAAETRHLARTRDASQRDVL